MSDGPRRLLYVFANAHLGGAENITLLMLQSHDPAHYAAQAYFLQDGPMVEMVKRLGFRVHVWREPLHLRQPLVVLRVILAIDTVLVKERIELVHSCMSYAHIVAGAAAKRRGLPAVWFQHGPVGGSIDKLSSLVPARLIFANSVYTKGKQEATQLRSWPVEVVPLATNLTPSARTQGDRVGIALLSRLAPGKGLDFAIEALAPLLRRQASLRLTIVGGPFGAFFPAYQGQLQAMAQALGVAPQIEFAGFQTDVRPFLAGAQILLSASFEEAFGLTLIEGMACGAAVVASRVGGAAEVLQDGIDGLYYPAGEKEALRACIDRVLHEPGLRDRLASAAAASVEAKYRPATMMQRLERHYAPMLRA